MSTTATLSTPIDEAELDLTEQIERCYAELENQRAQFTAELPRLLENDLAAFESCPRSVCSVEELVARHAVVVKSRKVSRRRRLFGRRPAWVKILSAAKRRGEDPLKVKQQLRLTDLEHRELLFGGILPPNVDQRCLTAVEQDQVNLVRRGYMRDQRGRIVPLCKHKMFGLTAKGRLLSMA